MVCDHDLSEMETACADGQCPICASGNLTRADAEIERLRRDCAELYQVIGTMAESYSDPEAAQIIKALDNASAAANGDLRPHDDLLPFILEQRVDKEGQLR
jgi:hypothetical protein